MRRSVLSWVCVLALVALPGGGCGEETAAAGGTGGSGNTGGDGGTGGTTGQEFPCTEQGIRDAVTEGGGPHTFDCDGPQTVVTEAEIVIDNDVILDGEGNLTVDGNEDHRVFEVAEGVTVAIRGFIVSGGLAGPGPKSTSAGGGIRNRGTLAVTNSSVSENTVNWGVGGGIFNTGVLTVQGATLSGNRISFPSCEGGAVFNEGTLTILNSTVSGNTDDFAPGSCDGSSVSNHGTLSITSSTVSEDTVQLSVIWNEGTLSVTSSIIDGDCMGDITSDGYNIESPGDTCGFDQPTDQADVTEGELNLGPLADNGGPTMTHALLTEPTGSVAIDRIPAEECLDAEGQPLLTDQRGEKRPMAIVGAEPMCDVGAFEVEAPCSSASGGCL